MNIETDYWAPLTANRLELSDSLLPLFLWGSLGAFLVSSEATLMFELANRRPDPATASVDMSDDTPGSDSATGSD